jgi:hypothetical protein
MGEATGPYKIVVGKPKGRRHFEYIDGRIILTIDSKET